jgi:hypothetical protein
MKSLKLFIILFAIIFTNSYKRTRSLTRRHKTTDPGEVHATHYGDNSESLTEDAYVLKILKAENKIQFTSKGEVKSVNINKEDVTISSVSAKFEKTSDSNDQVQGILTITTLLNEDKTKKSPVDQYFMINDTTWNIFSFLIYLGELIDTSSDLFLEVTVTGAKWKASDGYKPDRQFQCGGSCKLILEPTGLFMKGAYGNYVGNYEVEIDYVNQAEFFRTTERDGNIQGILKVTKRRDTDKFYFFHYYRLNDKERNIDSFFEGLNLLQKNPKFVKRTELTKEASDDEVLLDWTRRHRK